MPFYASKGGCIEARLLSAFWDDLGGKGTMAPSRPIDKLPQARECRGRLTEALRPSLDDVSADVCEPRDAALRERTPRLIGALRLARAKEGAWRSRR